MNFCKGETRRTRDYFCLALCARACARARVCECCWPCFRRANGAFSVLQRMISASSFTLPPAFLIPLITAASPSPFFIIWTLSDLYMTTAWGQ